jgi:hypothetical protein
MATFDLWMNKGQQGTFSFLVNFLSINWKPHHVTIDLWMSKGQQGTFAFLVNFLSIDWKPHHVTIDIFEANALMGVGLARQLKAMLEKFGLTSKVL